VPWLRREERSIVVQGGGGPVYEIFTHGRFEVAPENEQTFVDAWSEFAAWASERDGAGTLRLVRDVRNPGRFVSFGQWDDADAVRAWKSSAEFKERIGRVVKQAKEFEPTELVAIVKVTEGTVEVLSPPAGIGPIHAPA
jgi:heme-degrading monooxygenase HmoA